MQNLVENQFGHGGIISLYDHRDYKLSDIGGATIPFDWNKGFDIEKTVGILPVKNQLQSYSCGGQAWSSYSYVLDGTNREEKSAKYIYAQTHVGHGGSSGRDNSSLCVKQGVSTEALCSSQPSTEVFMTTNDITAQAKANALTNENKSYLAVNKDIESVAQAIRDSNGVILGIYGKNNGTWLSKFPQPSTTIDGIWAHWVYAGKAILIDGKKYIGFLNSWGNAIGEKGWQYIGEDYFNSNWGFFEIWSMMGNTDILPKYVFTEVLRFGSKGLAVKMLQTKFGLTADGIFGNQTKQAVVVFQTTHGLVGDGIVGAKTNAILNQ